MWKVKLDDDVWLGNDSTTTINEDEAWLFEDMPSVQAQLKKVCKFIPYKEAMVVAAFNQEEPNT